MNFIISANTDIGAKPRNQDCLSVLSMDTSQGRMAFAVLCDGMGGLEMGEIASSSVVKAFRRWATEVLPGLCRDPLSDQMIRQDWTQIVNHMNNRIQQYGKEAGHGARMGTTVVAMLLTQDHFYILNVGDSRAYELCGGIRQLTTDQSVVARELAMGHITEEEAKHHPQRNVLLQCVGAMDAVYPDIISGPVRKDAVYLLCSDGFRHEVEANEIYESLQPDVMLDEYVMQRSSDELIEVNKQRGEQDNISVVLVRTF